MASFSRPIIAPDSPDMTSQCLLRLLAITMELRKPVPHCKPRSPQTTAKGSENCDVAIDLGAQDPNKNGLFPSATVFVGSNFPPFSASSPWTCGAGSGVCAVSFPAAAIVGQVQGHYVIFVNASSTSTPPAQLPGGPGSLQPQPVGIYLFQKM